MGNRTKKIVVTGITAAVYTVLTIGLPVLSYKGLRFSEVMNLLPFINPIFAPGIVIGCFISNLFSPYGFIDCIIGTFATGLAVYCITKTKSLFVATLWPTVFCLLIGVEILIISSAPFNLVNLLIYSFPFMSGEFIVMTIVGYPVFKYLLQNKSLMDKLKKL